MRILGDDVVIRVADTANRAQVKANHLAVIGDIRRGHRNLPPRRKQ